MTEIDVTLTDYVLCIESLIFALIISKCPGHNTHKLSYLILFYAFSASSLLGGTYHGFIKSPLLWQTTIISIGISAYGFALSGINLISKPSSINNYKRILLIIVSMYTVATFFYQSFLIAIIVSLPATILTLIGFTKSYRKSADKNLKLGIIGIYISLIAPFFQQLKISLHPTYFTHNAVYHVIIMVSLFLFFRGAIGAINYLDKT